MSLVQQFSIGRTVVRDGVVVTIRGDLDAATAPKLRDALEDLGDHVAGPNVVVDIEGVTFIDSSGVYVLVQAVKAMQALGGSLRLSGANPGAYKVLDVCGLTGVFDLHCRLGNAGRGPMGEQRGG